MSQLRQKLSRALARAISDFRMIADGDRILCAVSGGKDSYGMHALLTDLRRRAPIRFEVLAVNIDQGQPGYEGDRLSAYMRSHGYPFHRVSEDTYSIVKEKIPEGKTYCSLCSRLRRGILYRLARELACTKIALGHHRDDAIVTFLLNFVFSGQLKAMPPKLVSDAGDNIVIRPLIYCAEEDLAAFAVEEGFPIIPCDLCGSQVHLQRKAIARLLSELDARCPGARQNMLAALSNVRPSHLLDSNLWHLLGLEVAREPESVPDSPPTADSVTKDLIPAHAFSEALSDPSRSAVRASDASAGAVPTGGVRLSDIIRNSAAPSVITAAIAWAVTVAPAAFDRASTPLAMVCALSAFAAALIGPLVARGRPALGRHVGISAYCVLGAATWIFRSVRHPSP